MQDIEELERRIASALDRVGQGVETLRSAPRQTGEIGKVEELKTELAEERVANDKLGERVKMMRRRHKGTVGRLESEISQQRETLARLDSDLQRLRKVNEQLRESNRALRAAHEAGTAEPDLINKALQAELEALHAGRAADMAEASALKGCLEPLLRQAAEVAQQEEGG